MPRPSRLPSPRRVAPSAWLVAGTLGASSANAAFVAPATDPATPSAAPATPATSPAATATPAASTPATTTPPATPATPATSPLTTPAPASATPASTATAEGPSNAPSADAPPAEPIPAATPVRVPRVDGVYIGGTLAFSESFARVNNFPTPNPFAGATPSLRVGQAIFPWMTIGIQVTGTFANRFADPRQRLFQGSAIIDFGFLPVPRIPLSLRVGFGAGGGAVRQDGIASRSGFGGAVFTGAVRYEFFPLAARKRPKRGGGFALGPELGWIGFTPAAKGRPMSNTVYLGLFMAFYFGS